MDLGKAYLKQVTEMLADVRTANASAVDAAAAAIADTLADNGLLHCFGSGHSTIVAREAINRAGGLVPISQIVDPTNGWAEVAPGYGTLLMQHYMRHYDLKKGEIVVVVSNSGINPSLIEVATAAREAGARILAITSVGMSREAKSRHSSGKRLFELADWVLDNQGIPGDAAVDLPGNDLRVGPTSTFTGCLLMNLLILKVIEILSSRGAELPLLQSANVPGGKERNKAIVERYKGRMCWPV